MAYKMIIDLNVFRALMKNIIVRDLYITLIITMKHSSKRMGASINNHRSQSNSDVASVRAQYLDYVLERATTIYFCYAKR